MKAIRRCISAFLVLATVLGFSLNALAGTYNVTETIGGSWQDAISIINTAGVSKRCTPFGLNDTATNVTSFTGAYILKSDAANGWKVGVYYSANGSNFTYSGVQLTTKKDTNVSYTVNFGSSLKTIKAIAFVFESSQSASGATYTITNPTFTKTLTDNTAPAITLTEQSGYSAASNLITATITDSQSGVSIRKQASGSHPVSYFASSGTTFSGSGFYVYSNGTYTVYAKDAAGNETVKTISATKIDSSPPSISASASTTYAPTNTISVTVADGQSGVNIRKWAAGYQSTSYFNSGGTTFTGSTITVSANGYYTLYAKDSVGNAAVYQVYVSYVDNTVIVTHPISVNYSINPNSAAPFSCPDITIENNSRIKILVSVQQFKATAGGSISLTDVPPSKYSDWSRLNRNQTLKDIALGLRVKETGTGSPTWYYIITSGTYYAANISSKTALGILNPNGATGTLAITANCGLAWDNAYTSKHELVLVFDAY